ncbi:tyrosine phosphatase family protein [Pseudohoeflea coraliihabitans]|uniref:Tyrosine phosphatase family protein n=1 Tax=Pseudohoeflea coraliihabitans TaxID=2860393 RepID=A0ABS6WPI4_9HYPH|nr:tyrosine phosphatase family protein [Pseudohoeflea sp. DP4N28-3]MBW3097881.1 tyrosine phosphatase family protein [Pseudohoeflea sp. DP4N28-3]
MASIFVCRLDQIAETAARHTISEMISLVAAAQAFHRPGVIRADRHLNLALNDIVDDRPGFVAPAEAHVEQIIAFARGWDRSAPLLVHCWLGISRSPAAALIAALAAVPDQDDDALVQRLRAASPEATPNGRLIALADALLERNGRLVRAVERIGRGAEARHGNVFQLIVDPREAVADD